MEPGHVLFLTLAITGLLGLMISGLLEGAVTQRKFSDRYQLYTEELSIAEFQINKAYAEVSYSLKRAGASDPLTVINNIHAAAVPGYEVAQSISNVTDVTGLVSAPDLWAGYDLRQVNFTVSAQARRTDERGAMYEHPGVAVRQDIGIKYIPLCVYGIFSAPDLEVHPGADFAEEGRVHCNHNIYYGSDGKKLSFKNDVTAAGHIIYGRHKDSGKGLSQGNNSFWDGTQEVSSSRKGTNVDYKYSSAGETWVEVAQELWKGHVLDYDMHVPQLDLPWPEQTDPITIIQPKQRNELDSIKAAKFAYQAGLTICRYNGQTTAALDNGTPVSLKVNIGGTNKDICSLSSIYNERDAAQVNLLTVDLNLFKQAGISPLNGIVYVQNQDVNGAVRLINGSDLPGDHGVGFTVATPNPLYVQGDYNTVNKAPALLAGDAINILSSGWKDSDNNDANKRKSAPNASGPTVTNAVIAAGNVPTQQDGSGGKHYSGGVENFFRYLEKWNGSTVHTFKGSILLMFKSLLSTGTWDKQNYSAPKRQWSWDHDLQTKAPPGTPITFVTSKSNWSLKY